MDKWEKLVALLKEIFTEGKAEATDEVVETTEKVDMNEAPVEQAPAEVEVKEETKDEEPVDVEADKIRELMAKAGLDPEDENEQKAFLAGMAFGKESMDDACKDACGAKDACGTKDEDVTEEGTATASDSMAEVKKHFTDLYKASVEVESLIGRIKEPMAFDSADDIYKKALEKKGIKLDGIAPSAYAGMVAVLKANQPAKMDDSVDDDPINKKLMGIKSF